MPLDGSGGFLLSLLTESFAVRALLGSLAVTALALRIVRRDRIHGRAARRAVVLAPLLVAAAAGLAVLQAGGAFLPQLWVASSTPGPAGEFLDFLGELRMVGPRAGLDLLGSAYAAVALVLLSRRAAGLRRCASLLAAGTSAQDDPRLAATVRRLAAAMGLAAPPVLLVQRCPGGAFTAGIRRPVIAIDPELLGNLDERELEGLLAHELAHVKRRDTQIGLAVGVFRDLTFFLPPVHVALRWLRREQEESADELASEHTRRPVSLASGILKVFDRHTPLAPGWAGQLACAAVGVSPAQRAVTERVERLIERPRPALSARRRRAELAAAAALIVLGSLAAWLVPSWIARDLNAYSLSFIYLSAPPVRQVESPAFATFRALTPEARVSDRLLPGPAAAPLRRPLADHLVCPCIETPAQLRRGEAATAENSGPRMLWRSAGHDAWEIAHLRERAGLRSRPLFALTDAGPQVGFFVVARTPRSL